jgi:hypothetical protein
MISFWNSSALSCAAISRERTPAHPNSRLSRFAASDRRDSEKPRQPPHKCKPLTRTVGLREVSRSAIVLPRVSLAPLFGSRGSDLSKMRICLDTHQRHARTRRQPADGNPDAVSSGRWFPIVIDLRATRELGTSRTRLRVIRALSTINREISILRIFSDASSSLYAIFRR